MDGVRAPLGELIADIADLTGPEHVLSSGEYVGRHRSPEWPVSDQDKAILSARLSRGA